MLRDWREGISHGRRRTAPFVGTIGKGRGGGKLEVEDEAEVGKEEGKGKEVEAEVEAEAEANEERMRMLRRGQGDEDKAEAEEGERNSAGRVGRRRNWREDCFICCMCGREGVVFMEALYFWEGKACA